MKTLVGCLFGLLIYLLISFPLLGIISIFIDYPEDRLGQLVFIVSIVVPSMVVTAFVLNKMMKKFPFLSRIMN